MSNHFITYAQTATEVAAAWPTHIDATAEPSEEQFRYNTAAEIFSTRILEANASLPDQFSSPGILFGHKTLLRYCQLAARLSRQEDTPKDELLTLLRHDKSFESLSTIATQPNTIAMRVETYYQIDGHNFRLNDSATDKTTLSDGFFNLLDIDRVVEEKRRLARLNEAPIAHYETRGCAAHKKKVLQSLYLAAVTICDRDENLFDRSLAEKV